MAANRKISLKREINISVLKAKNLEYHTLEEMSKLQIIKSFYFVYQDPTKEKGSKEQRD